MDLVNFSIYQVLVFIGAVAVDIQGQNQSSNPQDRQPPTHPGSNNLELPKGLTLQNLHKRPSIAPVPAFLEANGIDITVETDSESEPETEPAEEDEIQWATPVPE